MCGWRDTGSLLGSMLLESVLEDQDSSFEELSLMLLESDDPLILFSLGIGSQ